MGGYAGKKVVITGAGSGLGLATARSLVNDGAAAAATGSGSGHLRVWPVDVRSTAVGGRRGRHRPWPN